MIPHWFWNKDALALEAAGEIVHIGDNGFIHRVGEYLGQAVYQVHRVVKDGNRYTTLAGGLVRGKAAALACVS